MVYQWRKGSHIGGVDPQEAGDELERVREEYGALTAKAVVEVAADAASPLHPAFTWDDEVAATEYRLDQARHLVRSLVVVGDPETKAPYLRYTVVDEHREDARYLPVREAMADEETRRKVLARALSELEQFRRKYAELMELAEVFGAIERVAVGV